MFWAGYPCGRTSTSHVMGGVSQRKVALAGAPLADSCYLLADRKARRWDRSGMQSLEASRDTPAGAWGADVKGDSSFLHSTVLHSPPRPRHSEQEAPPTVVPFLPSIWSLASTYATKGGWFIRQKWLFLNPFQALGT